MEVWAECFSGDPRYLKNGQTAWKLTARCRPSKGWKRNKDKREVWPIWAAKRVRKGEPNLKEMHGYKRHVPNVLIYFQTVHTLGMPETLETQAKTVIVPNVPNFYI